MEEDIQRKINNLINRVNELSQSFKTLGEALDANAKVLLLVSHTINLLCRKGNISNAEIQQAILDDVKENIARVSVRSEQAGADDSDPGRKQSDVLHSEIDREPKSSSGIQTWENEGGQTNSGDIANSNGPYQ